MQNVKEHASVDVVWEIKKKAVDGKIIQNILTNCPLQEQGVT